MARRSAAAVIVICSAGSAAIGFAGVLGYVFGNVSLASIFLSGRPVAAVTGLCLIALAVSIFLRRSPRSEANILARLLAMAVTATMMAEVVTVVLGVSAGQTSAVPLHPYPVTAVFVLLTSLGGAPRDARRRSAVALIGGSTVLVLSVALLFAYVFAMPWVVDRSIRYFPVLASTWGVVLVSIALLLVEPTGWVRLLCSRSSAGAIARLLLPAAIAVPLLTAMAVDPHRSGDLLSSGGLTIIVAVNMAFAAALILGGASILQRKEAGRERLAAIVERERSEHTASLEEAVSVQTEELRRRAEKLEVATHNLSRSNRELEAFTYSVSHDLRAPLRAMAGFSRILLEQNSTEVGPKGRDYLERIRKATDRMSLLIDDLLSLSQVDRHSLRVIDVDLSALVRGVADELRAGEPERGVDLVIPDGIRGPGDPALLRIALQNLLGNAWKFTSKNPRARIEFGAVDSADRAYFVRDDGAGFDTAYAQKLFTPFQRLHSGSEFEGTGIGLALVERIIHRHGGTVRAEGEVGRGATFFFSLTTHAVGEQQC